MSHGPPTDVLYDAFLGPHFDPVFSQVAVTADATAALEVDVPDWQQDATRAIEAVVDAASAPRTDPALRTVLVEGAAGAGKTHRLGTTLLRLSRQGLVYPAVMQLSASITPAAVPQWLLHKVMDELTAVHFADEAGRTPLQRLADRLWALVPDRHKPYRAALVAEDWAGAIGHVENALAPLRRALKPRGVTLMDVRLLAALMLLADEVDDVSFQVDSWLRGGSQACTLGRFTLEPLRSPADYQSTLAGLARIAHATGAPLVLALDQIESISRVGDQPLMSAVLAGVLQLVEETVSGLGVVIAALTDTWHHLVRDALDASYQQRIEMGQPRVRLASVDRETVNAVLARRLWVLLHRARVRMDVPTARALLLPPGVVEAVDTDNLRDVFQAVRDHRSACLATGRLLRAEEIAAPAPPSPAPPSPAPSEAPPATHPDDFDKMWADFLDRTLGQVDAPSEADKERLLTWLLTQIPVERPEVGTVSVSPAPVEAAEAVRSLRVRFEGRQATETWAVGLVNAPNRKGRLQEQLETFLAADPTARPALVRDRAMPGVGTDGLPEHPLGQLAESVQPGAALTTTYERGGRVVVVRPKDWVRLILARRFVAEREAAAGFLSWRQTRRFLLEAAEIGGLARLGPATLVPVLMPPAPAPAQPPATAASGPILVGHDDYGDPLAWDLDPSADPPLPNFGLLVSGDSGQGKTQIIKALVAEVAARQHPFLIFDFKNDYGGEGFATAQGAITIDLNAGLPFNPLKLPPHGASGAQAINHIYEVADTLRHALRLGEAQKALLRQAMEEAFTALGVPLHDWVDPDTTPAPSLADVVALAEARDARASQTLVSRLGLLHGKNLLPADAIAQTGFADLLTERVVLSFNRLPNDDQLKRALAELILIQVQGHMLRGDQPRQLRRLLVFDEAWRAADSKCLIHVAREGRAFGVGVIVGSQFADDLADDLTGNLATRLHLHNSNAGHRRGVAQRLTGSLATAEARALLKTLADLGPFQGVMANQQLSPYVQLTVLPYFKRQSG